MSAAPACGERTAAPMVRPASMSAMSARIAGWRGSFWS
jgi:hypothetical protein